MLSMKIITEEMSGFNTVYKELSESIGVENMLKLYNSYKGTQVFFPGRLYSSDYIHNKIRMEYNGGNIQKLAQKYNYSIRTVWRVVKDNSDKNNNCL